jgi:hypothetical protein
VGWLRLAAVQFPLAAGNRVGVQAGDLCEVGDASRTVFLGEEADEEPSGAFVSDSDKAVDPAVFPGQGTMRMLLAGWASAHMDETLAKLLDHRTGPPSGGPRTRYDHSTSSTVLNSLGASWRPGYDEWR